MSSEPAPPPARWRFDALSAGIGAVATLAAVTVLAVGMGVMYRLVEGGATEEPVRLVEGVATEEPVRLDQAIGDALRMNAPRFEVCRVEHLGKNGEWPLRLAASWSIVAGKPTNARLIGNTTGNKEFAACVLRVVSVLRVDKSVNAEVKEQVLPNPRKPVPPAGRPTKCGAADVQVGRAELGLEP